MTGRRTAIRCAILLAALAAPLLAALAAPLLAAIAAPLDARDVDAEPPGSRITVAVDQRVELMSIIFRLAGNREYNQRSSMSPYAEAVEAHFGRFRDHPAIVMARDLRTRRGVSYDAVMSMAMHLVDTIELEERIPFDQRPERLDERWRVTEARRFLEQARFFVAASRFNWFLLDHGELYDEAAARLRSQIDKRDYVGWFDRYFGARPGATFRAAPGLLNGGANYGVGIRFADGTEEIAPVIGVWRFDDEGLPVFDDGVSGTIVHELCHSYTNPIVDRFADQLEPHASRIYPGVAEAMRRQAYGNWKTLMYESLVRACTVRYVLESEGPEAARREVERHRQRGFAWVDGLAARLETYETQREAFPTLDDFMPTIVAFFEQYADGLESPDPE